MQEKTATKSLWYGECLCLLHASVFMEKNYSDKWHSVKNTGKTLTLKQMFDKSEKLITEKSDEIFWSDSSQLGRLFMDILSFGCWWTSQSSAHQSLRILRFCIMLWKDERERTMSQWNSGGTSSQDSPRCSSATKMERTTRNFHWTDYFHVDVQRHLMVILRQRKWVRIKCSARFSLCQDFQRVNGHPQREWDKVAEQMMFTFAESKHPVCRSTSPISRGVLKSKGGGKLSMRFSADGETVETVFRTK